eukprot:TRINITY_DN66619_c0_g1_i1.p1 TRINITY_DN66619_c0_g1~~TRINITY_DN66619_c0_g1_i1.p1  ORF type:complete len:544 (+),score=56.71 TRINITY_DN66619_c0_g1_i1:64-1695(+)
MIDYSEEWLVALLFQVKGSVAVRACYYALPSALFTLVLKVLDVYLPEFREVIGVDVGLDKSQLWSASTVILLMLLSFRTNRAMARFWEGTGLLHQMRGEWYDAISCCATFTRSTSFNRPRDVKVFRHTLVRLMSVCHGSALAEIADIPSDSVETLDTFGLDNETLLHLKRGNEYNFNRVELLLHMIQTLITAAHEDNIISVAPPILSRVYQTLSRGFVNLLNAKKIADTRFPFPYAQLITLMLLVNCVMIPLTISHLIKSLAWAPIYSFMITFGLFSLNFIGIELEDPFGDDDNDLPLGQFQHEMNRCLLMFLEDNCDLIPSLSETRCCEDFDELLRRSQDKAHMRHRISNWSDSNQDSTVENAYVVVCADINISPVENITAKYHGVKSVPIPLENKDDDVVAQCKYPLRRVTIRSPEHGIAEGDTEGALQTVMEDAPHQDFASCVADFRKSLQDWTIIVDQQVAALANSFSQLSACQAELSLAGLDEHSELSPGARHNGNRIPGHNKTIPNETTLQRPREMKLSHYPENSNICLDVDASAHG